MQEKMEATIQGVGFGVYFTGCWEGKLPDQRVVVQGLALAKAQL